MVIYIFYFSYFIPPKFVSSDIKRFLLNCLISNKRDFVS